MNISLSWGTALSGVVKLKKILTEKGAAVLRETPYFWKQMLALMPLR
jgi:hypothetical protein